eukprot:124291_1
MMSFYLRIVVAVFIISQYNARASTIHVLYNKKKYAVAYVPRERISVLNERATDVCGAAFRIRLSKRGALLPEDATAYDAGLVDGGDVDAQDANAVPYFDIGIGKENDSNAELLLCLLAALSISIGTNVGLCAYILCRRIESKNKNVEY